MSEVIETPAGAIALTPPDPAPSEETFVFHVSHPKYGTIHYVPHPKQLEFHRSVAPNCIMEGTRGTGKSHAIRMDAHMIALAYPGFTYLILRRTMPELRKTHLKFIRKEMRILGGFFNKAESIAYYPNGSIGIFGHCETADDLEKHLGGEYHTIYFDEMVTFSGEQIGKISTCARVPEDSGLIARVRGGTNPIGPGAEFVHAYYIAKDVDPTVDADYDPADYQAIHTVLTDNPSISQAQYRKRFSNLPDHVRRAWLDGEWIVEGAYFADFRPFARVDDDVIPWHVLNELPRLQVDQPMGGPVWKPITSIGWMVYYRALDWGWYPDPAVYLLIAMLPNGRAVVVAERHWTRTTAALVAAELKDLCRNKHVVDTFADPTLFRGSEDTEQQSIGDIFETQGIPLTKGRNDRVGIGFAIHEWLNTVLEDGLPKLQIYGPGCPMLVKTLPLMRIDKHNAAKIADGNDHWVITLGYFCQSSVTQSKPTPPQSIPDWKRHAGKSHTPARAGFKLGSESVRSAARSSTRARPRSTTVH